jgi:Flp pilus assembly pilin Flp
MSSFARVLRRFFFEDDGMVTVEWVAIAAAVTVGGIAIAWTVLNSMDPAASSVGATLDGVPAAPTQPSFGDGN